MAGGSSRGEGGKEGPRDEGQLGQHFEFVVSKVGEVNIREGRKDKVGGGIRPSLHGNKS